MHFPADMPWLGWGQTLYMLYFYFNGDMEQKLEFCNEPIYIEIERQTGGKGDEAGLEIKASQ